MVELPIPGDKVLLLDEGRLDTASWLAFLGGHCHSLALALHARTGWPLVAIDNASGECVHVAVRSPTDRIVDVTGAHSPAQMIEASSGGGIRPLDKHDVDQLPEAHGWAEPAPDPSRCVGRPRPRTNGHGAARADETTRAAAPEGDGRQHRSQGHVGRRAGTRRRRQNHDHTRRALANYGYIAFPKDHDGVWRISFYEQPFKNLAETWLHRNFDERRAEQTLLEASRTSD